jgi:RsiW-degrading membrane proteinase PrsW (M82 family)
MSVTAQALNDSSGHSADQRLALIGAVTVLFSITAFIAGLLGVLPPGISTAIVMLGMVIALRVAWTYVARSATSASRTRITTLMSNAGLAISAVAIAVALPRLTKTSGVGVLLIDLLAQLWTVAILAAAAATVRTLGWRAFLGAFLFGFLGLNGLARFLGRPVILALGTSSVFAAGIWVPVTEELSKMIPVMFILVLAMRRTESRPSLLDLVLVGASAAAGFAVNENAGYGRGGFSLTASTLLSPIYPGALHGSAYGWTVIQTGHLVHTALITLGVGFAFLYRHRVRRSWIVALVAISVTLTEHCSQNAMITGHVNEVLAKILLVLTLNGRLATLLLVAGVAYAAILESRAVGVGFQARAWWPLRPSEIQRRRARLASLQTSAGAR